MPAPTSKLKRACTRCCGSAGLEFRTGCNVDPHQRWPAEETVLVADLPLPQAHKLAVHFGQLAFLWCDASAVPRLHLAAID